MPGEGLEVPYRLAALSEEGEAAMPEVVESYISHVTGSVYTKY